MLFSVTKMFEQLRFIAERFQYRTDISIVDMSEIWKEKLGIEIDNKLKTSFMVIRPPLQETYEVMKKLEPKSVPTDCRFFAMFISTMCSYPKIVQLFFMHLNLKTIEVMVPENCLYISLDTTKYVIKKETESPEYIPSYALGSDQGQWICKFNERYMGIGDDGIIELELKDWVERYSECVKKHTNFKPKFNDTQLDLKQIYLSILKSLIGLHGLCVSAYKFEDIKIIDILR